jgi:ferredoxin
MRKTSSVIVALGAIFAVATAGLAGAPVKVVDTTAYEFGSAAGGDWLAWSRGPTLGGDYDLHVRQTGQPATVLDAGRFQEVGNIEIGGAHGDILVYSVKPGSGDSNIRFYDLPTGGVMSPPAGVNTDKDEDNPAISGEHLLFGRGPAGRALSTRVILFNLTTSISTVVATAPTGSTVLANSVRGDFASYTVCPSTGRCNSFRYRISTGGKVKMPNPNRATYWSSVLSDGTVYFVQGSPRYCGVNTKIMRWRNGSVANLYSLAQGIEVADLDAVEGIGGPVVYFTRINCTNNAKSGIWKIDG